MEFFITNRSFQVFSPLLKVSEQIFCDCEEPLLISLSNSSLHNISQDGSFVCMCARVCVRQSWPAGAHSADQACDHPSEPPL